MMFNATFNNISAISWRSVLLVEETRGFGEYQWPVASHRQTLSHKVVHIVLIEIRTQFVRDLRQIGCTPDSSTNKSNLLDITEILLKVALNTIKRTSKKHQTNIKRTSNEHQTNIKQTSNEHQTNIKQTKSE